MYDNVAPHAWSPPNFPHSDKEAKVAEAQKAVDHYRIASALRWKECLPSKHEARFHAFYLFLWLFNLFNNLGSLLFAQS